MKNPLNKIVYAMVGVLFDEQGRVLLLKRQDLEIPEADRRWELPGGSIEFGETASECLIREFREETGFLVEVIRMIDFVWSNIWENPKLGIKEQAILFPFLCFKKSGKLYTSDQEIIESGWFFPNELLRVDLLPGTQEIVNYSLKYVNPKNRDVSKGGFLKNVRNQGL